jgi:hypothetical protein
MATNVFISYRRDDVRDFTGRIVDRLRGPDAQKEGIGKVFFDVDTIEPGADFKAKIEGELKQCEFCLLIIGANWLGKGGGGEARIKQDRDFVRLEAREALSGEIKVLPVLANEATMPQPEDLPEDLASLPRINAVSVRSDSFDRDADYLIDIILKRKKPGSFQAYLNRHPLQAGLLRGAIGFVIALFILILGAALQQAATGKALDQVLGGAGPVLLLVIAVLAVGTALPFLTGRRRRRVA